MAPEVPCRACGAVARRGTPPRCAACGEPVILDAVAADDDRLPELEAPLDEEVQRLANSHRVARLTAAQRLMFGLLANTLDDARRQDRVLFAVAYGMGPLLLACGLAVGMAFMAAGYWLLVALRLATNLPAEYALYGIPVLVVIFARVLKSNAEKSLIDLNVVEGKVIGLRMGRLGEAFNSGAIGSPPLFLGCAFGMMWGLLYFTPDHAGAPVLGGFAESFWLTLDNLCHGIFLDFCELYDLRFGARLEHSTQSATVFNLFRLSFDALVVVFLYETWRRWQLRRLFNDFPYEVRDIDAVLAWIGRACADRNRLPTHYLDELLFLILAKEYLQGNEEMVRQLSAQFAEMPVTPRVRRLFLSCNENEVLFHGDFAAE